MDYFLAVLIITFLILAVLLQVISLPGNWVAIILIVIWKFIGPSSTTIELTWPFVMLLAGIAAVGELLEWAIQMFAGRKYGSSTSGSIAGIIGSIIGAIMLLPLFFGFGAVLGALLGAYLGCLAAELLQGRPGLDARQAAWGTFLGRFVGMSIKLSLGIIIIWLTIERIWPSLKAAADVVVV